MNSDLILLLTHDPIIEQAIAEAVPETGGISCLARTAGEAMGIVCSKNGELALAVIDFDHGSNGMTLISSINACTNHHIPMVALIPPGDEHARFVALANGATDCLAKPISTAQMAKAIINCRPNWELSEGCARRNFSAAFVKPSCSATATK